MAVSELRPDPHAAAGGAAQPWDAALQRLLERASALLDHVLAQHPQARERLRAHADKSLQLRAGGVQLTLRVDAEGALRMLPASETAGEAAAPALRLDVDVARWASAQLRGGPEAALGGVRIAGDAEFAQVVSWLLGHVRWDAEADLARVVGDVLAHRAVRLVGGAAQRARALAGRVETDAREWLREAPRGLVGRWELDGVAAELARLRDATARLDKRVGALRRRFGG